MPTCRYFTLPYASLAAGPPASCTLWYAQWVTSPTVEPGYPPMVIGVTTGDLPPGATELAEATKDPLPNPLPPPPPPPPLVQDLSEYQTVLKAWAKGRGG